MLPEGPKPLTYCHRLHSTNMTYRHVEHSVQTMVYSRAISVQGSHACRFPVPEIYSGYPKKLGGPWICPRSLYSKNGFVPSINKLLNDVGCCPSHCRSSIAPRYLMRISAPFRPKNDNHRGLSPGCTAGVHCVSKKHPHTFSSISPWKMFRFKHNFQGMFVMNRYSINIKVNFLLLLLT